MFATIESHDGQRLVSLESKGDQLENLDTAYKADLAIKLSMAFDTHASETNGGELEFESETPDYQAVVLLSDMDAHLPGLIQPSTPQKVVTLRPETNCPHTLFFMFFSWKAVPSLLSH